MLAPVRLVVLVFAVPLFGAAFALRTEWPRATHAPGAEVQSEKVPPKILVVERKRYRLYYPLAFTPEIPLRDILERLDAAFARVERDYGPFKNRLDIAVPREIPNEEAKKNGLVIAGLTFTVDGKVNVLVALWAADKIDTFAHELVHARLRDAGIHPAHWFEEGLAHYAETSDGFQAELYDVLLKHGVIDPAKAETISGITKDEMRMRATAWALVYYMAKAKGMKLVEIAAARDLPDAETAFRYVKESHSGNSVALQR